MSYSEAKEYLEDLGFTNIVLRPLNDIADNIIGKAQEFFNKNGSVKTITINGHDSFKKDYVFEKNNEIIITYHSYK